MKAADMSMDPCILGIDGGTESLRAGVFDLNGTPLAFAATAYKTDFPRPGQAEQNPDDWWAAIGPSVRKAIKLAGIRPEQICALAVDTTCCSVVALDRNNVPLRPALIWMDVRSDAEAGLVAASGDDALVVNSGGKGPVSAEWMIPKALWLQHNQPEIYAAAATICEYQDYINYRLTGRMVASINNVAIRWHYRAGKGGYPVSLLQKLDLDDVLEKWPADIVPLGATIGGLTPEAAAHLDLPTGTPVAQGGADAFIGMIGLGVVRPGSMALITGSSHLQLGLSDTEFHGNGIWGTYTDALLPGLEVVEGGQTSSGSILNWFRAILGNETSYEQLDVEAAAVPPGSDGLIVQDHFQGNRTPYTDPNSRGAFTGLSLRHTRGHMVRAIMEGIAFGTELILENMRDNGYKVENIVAAGGATRSDLWLQIHADVSGVPLKLTRVPDAPSLGSAIIAAASAGHFNSIAEAAEAMVSVERIVEPDMETHARYRDSFAAYKRAYPALKGIAAG